jgi:transcription initiation factor TFIID subunit 2
MVQAMAYLRDVHQVCIPDVMRFLLDLFKYNDNSKNKYCDNYYRATLIDALSHTVTPAATSVSLITGSVDLGGHIGRNMDSVKPAISI